MAQRLENPLQTRERWWHMSARLLLVLGVFFIAVPTSALAAQAAPSINSLVQPNRPAGRFVNLNQAIRIAQEESEGQILSAKSVRAADGSQRHRIRVLVDGQRVTTMVVDQRGRVLRRR